MTIQEKDIISSLKTSGYFGIIGDVELYNGVLLVYDQDNDQRLKSIVDRVTGYFIDGLRVVYETDGNITMLWNNKVPEPFLPGNAIAATHDNDPFPHEFIDHWHIVHSLTVQELDANTKHKKLIDVIKSLPTALN